jgi:hypothetical protein
MMPKNARTCRIPRVVIVDPQNFSGLNIAQPRYTSRRQATIPETM